MSTAKFLSKVVRFPIVSVAAILLLLATVSGGDKVKPSGSSVSNDNGAIDGSSNPEPGQVVSCGDMNGDDTVDILDLDFFIDFYFNFGPAPEVADVGDLNCDANNDIADIVFLASFLNGDVTTICCGGYPGKDDPGPKDKQTGMSDKK